MKRIITVLAALAALGQALLAAGRVYIATDRDCYIAGDIVWVSAFCLDSNTGNLSEASAVAYLELCSSGGSARQAKLALSGGRGAGSFQIPSDAPTGSYRLFAYTAENKAEGGYDYLSCSKIISVINTRSAARAAEGVAITDAPLKPGFAANSSGLAVQRLGGKYYLTNTSSESVSVCASVFADDGIRPLAGAGNAGLKAFKGGMQAGAGAPAAAERCGEVISARLAGADATSVKASDGLVAFISVPGSKKDIYCAEVGDGGIVRFDTENIFGAENIMFEIDGLREGADCYIVPESPFAAPGVGQMPQISIGRGWAGALEKRTRAQKAEKLGLRDTLFTTLPMRRSPVFDEGAHVYHLDDYTRFQTMNENFVEFMPDVKATKIDGQQWICVKMEVAGRSVPFWGRSLMLIDGVPVFDHRAVLAYDPMLVKDIEVYPFMYTLGGRAFEGIVNFVTFQGNTPAVIFDKNVRIYDFAGVSYPVAWQGRQTLCWEPLLNLSAGERVELPVSATNDCVAVQAEGITASGKAVSCVISFE